MMKPFFDPCPFILIAASVLSLASCGRIGYELLNIDPQSTSTVDEEKATDSESSTPTGSGTDSLSSPDTDTGSDTRDPTETSSEVDLCSEDEQKVDPGICGCGIPDADEDGDGTPDCLDEPLIAAFDFLSAQNEGLSSDVIGEVMDSRIYLTLPTGTDLFGLVPHIAFQGAFVSPASGIAIDFSDSPVVYTVTSVPLKTKQYHVWVFGLWDNFDDNEGLNYSGWTEINFTNGELPLYVEQNSRLEWSRGELEEDHVTLNDSSYHAQSMTVSVHAGQLDDVGSQYVYCFYQDANNWYRLRRESADSGVLFEKRIDGAIEQISPSRTMGLGTWVIEVTDSGTISLFRANLPILSFSDPLSFPGGLIGLGGSSRRPVWDDFKVSK